jgi:hypothetical protein
LPRQFLHSLAGLAEAKWITGENAVPLDGVVLFHHGSRSRDASGEVGQKRAGVSHGSSPLLAAPSGRRPKINASVRLSKQMN